VALLGAYHILHVSRIRVKKEKMAARVARKAKSGMEVHRSIPKMWEEDRKKIDDVVLDRRTY
jgi:hypothetical protein